MDSNDIQGKNTRVLEVAWNKDTSQYVVSFKMRDGTDELDFSLLDFVSFWEIYTEWLFSRDGFISKDGREVQPRNETKELIFESFKLKMEEIEKRVHAN